MESVTPRLLVWGRNKVESEELGCPTQTSSSTSTQATGLLQVLVTMRMEELDHDHAIASRWLAERLNFCLLPAAAPKSYLLIVF